MRRGVLCAALAAAWLPLGAGAQTLSLTESEALARLSPNSPRVQAIRAAVDIARADVLAANRWPNPQPSVTRESVAGVTEYLTTVTQALPITGRRGLEAQAASALVSASSSRADDEVRRVRAELQQTFAGLVAAQVSEREITAARDRLRALVDVLAKREAAGDAAGFDRLRAEREVLDVEADLVVASTDRVRAQASLAGFFADVTEPARIVAVESGPSPAPVPSLEELLAKAESTRGELIALRHEAEAAAFAGQAADRRRVPEPEIVAGTKSSSVGDGDIGSVVTLRAAIPLFDQSKPERTLAAARAAHAEARAASFRLVLRGQVAALREAVLQRRAAAERYRFEAVSRVGQIERIAQVSYDAGERGILDVLDAYRVGASARLRQAALDLAVRQAELELSFLTGWEGSR
jgi:cobalt-zinc-cadmium efflux system outer membrane protein